jgi:hypothetical protein
MGITAGLPAVMPLEEFAMGKLITVVTTGIVAAALAVVTAFAVIASENSAPSSNPADQGIIQYGNR